MIPALPADVSAQLLDELISWKARLNAAFESACDSDLTNLAKYLARDEGISHPEEIVVGAYPDGSSRFDGTAPQVAAYAGSRRKLVCMAVGPIYPAWVDYLSDALYIRALGERIDRAMGFGDREA